MRFWLAYSPGFLEECAVPPESSVLISEIVDFGPNFRARFIELSNVECFPVSLENYTIEIFFNDNNSPGNVIDLSGGIYTIRPFYIK